MTKAVELAIKVSADASDASTAFEDAGGAARAMADDVDQAARTTDAAADRLGNAAEAADGVASSTAQAAGGIGDLGGALALMPGPLGAVGSGMESLSPALMGVTGAADLANLALASNVVQSTRAKAAQIAHAVATRTISAATKAYAAVQWVLNAALAANPIGLVIIAVVALVAVIVLAYKKSETFRQVVDVAMKAVKLYLFGVIIVIRELVQWIAEKAPGAWDKLKDAAVSAAKWIADKLSWYFDTVTTPIQAIIDLVDSLLDKISNIDLPDVSDIPIVGGLLGKAGGILGRTAVDGTSGSGAYIDARTYVTLDGSGVVDEAAVARALEPVLARQAVRLGQLVEAAPAW